jgi:predicted Zn-dependent peptidase
MVVIVAGKVQPGIHALLEKTFGHIKRKTGDDRPFDPFCQPATLKTAVAYQEKATEQVQIAMGFYGFPTGHADAPAAALLANLLGGNMSSRLFTEIRERRGLCYSINASHGTREDTGAFSIMAGLDKKRVPEAVKAIFGELKKLVKTAPTVHELNDAKQNARGRTMLAFEDSATQAEWYGKQWLFKKTLETPEERMRRFAAVTPSDIKRVAKKMFHPEKIALALIGPFGEKKNVLKFAKWS